MLKATNTSEISPPILQKMQCYRFLLRECSNKATTIYHAASRQMCLVWIIEHCPSFMLIGVQFLSYAKLRDFVPKSQPASS